MASRAVCSASYGHGFMSPRLSSRSECVPRAYKQKHFDSLIPEVLSDIESDLEYQAMVTRTKEQGQAALTRAESAQRQAVLNELDIVPWQRKMQVRALEDLPCCGLMSSKQGMLCSACFMFRSHKYTHQTDCFWRNVCQQ